MIRHHEHLQAMGIDVWVRRAAPGTPGCADARESGPSSTSLEDLQEAVRTCIRCELHRTRKCTVFGAGAADADWMFVGEAPACRGRSAGAALCRACRAVAQCHAVGDQHEAAKKYTLQTC